MNRPNPTSSAPSEPEGRILQFRPRGSSAARNLPQPPPASAAVPDPVPDLERFERSPEEPDEYRHRMIMNALGLAVTLALVVGGIWIADVMAHMRKDQDCVLVGRPGCTPVEVPLRPR